MEHSSSVAEKRNHEDVDRQVAMLAKAYRDAGHAVEVALARDDSSTRGRYHYRLTVNGYTVTDWVRVTTNDVWLALFDMRRAVEVLAYGQAQQ